MYFKQRRMNVTGYLIFDGYGVCFTISWLDFDIG